MSALEFHPLADIFPLVEGVEFDELVADIREHGLHEPIVVYEDKILDGRNRYRACLAAGMEPSFEDYIGDNPVAYVVSLNLKRRHLGPSERAMVAARLATLKDGQRQVGKFAYVPTQAQAAQLAGVSERSVKSARVVLEHGTPELQEAVDRGRLAVHFAEKAARESPEAQDELLAAVAAGRSFQNWAGNHERKKRAAELASSTHPLRPGQKRYPVILADPPWDFKVWCPDRSHSHPAHHYPVMSLDEIKALPVRALAADDCVLFLWTTVPWLEQGLEVLNSWGFSYKSSLVWDKEVAGLGYWVRGQHELLFIATMGNPPLPPMEAVPASVIRERRREHSRKPEASYAVIERMYPELPKIELFARQARPRWHAWGNEVPSQRCATNYLTISET